ncbi:anhydro-N-acetylmuramic acid kinase [Falsiroseomonas selenitidurans]|uniref:Anhydro-N-acetylmuramic acid kinase n=1 Tax=Falsiroseomonas selenitidurans TaxID=2716335 RepID=A0ABX1E3V7_9PROT|nr:anhydro-N-acetylmuramic acid kinase [Falsiroseomonas selenitidurans]NKC31766.1 anhydro-N-acetylmuramic acid kinase [Falsiroseomonas selenitidurans]
MRTIGLMSGTSLDGVDAAWVETDGEAIGRLGPVLTLPYAPALRRDLRTLLDRAAEIGPEDPFLAHCVARLTERHVEAVRAIGWPADLIGFHGQTILHRPQRPGSNAAGFTWQVGDAARLARETGMTVAHDFRAADVAAGGQGAPLVPVVHAVMAARLPKPLAILNLGGVANVTWIGADGRLIAFDTGPANGPLDDWARLATGEAYDRDGRLALAGQADGGVLAPLMAHPWLAAPPPKSLDRLDFDRALKDSGAAALSPADGAATLVAFCAICVAAAARHFPEPPVQWLVAGGGRRNPALMRALGAALAEPVRAVEVAGWNGDALEAQAFGVLAARVWRGLPLTFPGTTGAPGSMPGGRLVGPLL